MLNNLTNFSPLIKAGKIKTLLEASDLFTIGVRNPNFDGHYEPALITATALATSIGALMPPSITLTTTGTSGVSTLIGTVLNIPNYTSAPLPAWFEYNATDLTIWNNGQGNIATNTSYGDGALSINTTGSGNTALGYDALNSNITGINNVGVGYSALFNNTTGSNNVASGVAALQSNTTGFQNTTNGNDALYSNTTGGNNTSIGFQSLRNNTTGDSNSALGYNTQSGNFSGSVILGSSAAATANNQFVVGTAAVNAGAVTVEVNASSQVWNVVINGVARKILLA